jgi:hypothetical protein
MVTSYYFTSVINGYWYLLYLWLLVVILLMVISGYSINGY